MTARRFLFVKLRHIGDTLLLTPTLQAVRDAHPDARIDVVVRRGCDRILQGCPAVTEILTSAAPEAGRRRRAEAWHQIRQVLRIRRTGYDAAFDFTGGDRGRSIVAFSKARDRVTNALQHPIPFYLHGRWTRLPRIDHREIHQVEHDFRVAASILSLPDEPGPLVFGPEHAEPVEDERIREPFAILHVTARWLRKEWPMERWAQVARRLLRDLKTLVLDPGPEPREMDQARNFSRQLGERVICPDRALTFAQLAGLLRRARLFVGLDSVSMHLASACGTPTVALFGPTNPIHWGPWKNPRALVVAPDHIPLDDRKMDDLSVDSVLDACDRILDHRNPETPAEIHPSP